MLDREYQPPGQIIENFPALHLSQIKYNPNQSWLLKGVLPAQGLAVLFGPSGGGKSFLALDMSLAVASGRERYAGKLIKRRGGIVYISAEGAGGFINRLAATRDRFGLTGDQYGFVTIPCAPNLGTQSGDKERLISTIKGACGPLKIEPVLIVFDTLSRVGGGLDENASGAMSQLVSNIEGIAKIFNALALVIHHTGKVLENGMRGSSALFAAADAVLEISTISGPQKHVTLRKSKDGADNLGFQFLLKTETIATDEDGEPSSMCFVESVTDLAPLEVPQKKPDKPPLRSLRLWLAAFHTALDAKGKTVQPFPNGPKVRAVAKSAVLEAYSRMRPDDAEKTIRRGFDRGFESLLSSKEIIAAEVNGGAVLWLP